MRPSKRLLALSAALCLILGGCAPGSGESSSEAEKAADTSPQTSVQTEAPAETVTSGSETVTSAPETDSADTTAELIVTEPTYEELRMRKVNAAADLLPEKELSNGSLRLLEVSQTSPAANAPQPVAEELFTAKYGVPVEHIYTDFNGRFDMLASLSLSGKSPDLFPINGTDAFPIGAVKDMFRPVGDLVGEYGLPPAEDSLACNFVFDGILYGIAVEAEPKYLCYYGTESVSSAGLDDPARLFLGGRWDYNAFERLCSEYCQQSGRIGLGGYDYPQALTEAGGKALLSVRDGLVVSELESSRIADAQDLILSLKQKGLSYNGLDETFVSGGQLLFCPAGYSAVTGSLAADIADGKIGAVPVPSPESAGGQYMPAEVRGYYLCAASQNEDAALIYALCDKLTADIRFEDLLHDLGAPDKNADLADCLTECRRLANEAPVFGCTGGMPAEEINMMTGQLLSMTASGNAANWAEAVAAARTQLEYAVALVNDTEPAGP